MTRTLPSAFRPVSWYRTLSMGLASSILVSGCALVGPDFETPQAPLAEQWSVEKKTEFTQAVEAVRTAQINPVQWWQSFSDPVLSELLDLAAQQNLSLQSAALRIYQARAQLGISDASLLPSVAVSGKLVEGNSSTTRQGLIQANWELDLWGKYRRGIESSMAAYQASIAAYYAADVSLAATVANTYINIRNAESLIRVAQSNLKLQSDSLRIARARYNAGETSLLALDQARARYQQTKSSIPTLIAQLRMYQNALSTLLGQPPGFYQARFGDTKGKLTPPASLNVGIPKDLLRRRPDVALAEYQAASQSALIGMREADLYPSFSLGGMFSYLSASISYEGDNTFKWSGHSSNATLGFSFPIFYRGALVDQVRVQDAQFQQAVLNYQDTVLQAQAEVDNALMQISTAASTKKDLDLAVKASASAAKLALDQYEAGETDYNNVIVAQQAQLSAELDQVRAQTETLLGYVSAFKALGGGWTGDLTVPRLPAEMISSMQARTDWGQALTPSDTSEAVWPRLVSTFESK